MRCRHSPPLLLARAIRLRLTGRLHFPRDGIGEVVEGDEEDYEVFRKMVVDPDDGDARTPGAELEVGFEFARFSPATNRRLSRLPIPFIAAQPGFHSKTWLEGKQSGAFRGVYLWDSVEDAAAYWTSFPMRLMKRRAAPGTLTKVIRPTE